MLTRLIVRKFKRFKEIDVELGNPVVFIGPNNSGKTTALQALSLWNVGLKKWNEKRMGKEAPVKRPGVTINRRDLVSIPVPEVRQIWHRLNVREVRRAEGRTSTKNITIDILLEGVTDGQAWSCGLEFDYANEESIYCRPLRTTPGVTGRMAVPEETSGVNLAFLPPMSGLASHEDRLDAGSVNVRIGEGRTADVLRNLCYRVLQENQEKWKKIIAQIDSLFGVTLNDPVYIKERGEIRMNYSEAGAVLDLSSSGRGLQQTLLLLAFMSGNPGAILLLDEPDAHLEILRQRQVYELLCSVARENSNQIIAASHSEVLLNEAAGRDVVVAFVGKPHRIDDRGSQLLKSLREIGFEDYYQAEQRGWVLYLEGSTDLAILRTLAETLGHDQARKGLERPFVHYVGNDVNEVRKHFWGIREAVRNLQGMAVFDRLERGEPEDLCTICHIWKRRELENYISSQESLEAFADDEARRYAIGPLFENGEVRKRVDAMRQSITEIGGALEKLKKRTPWDSDTKTSDEFLTPLFETYYSKLGLPNLTSKKNFHEIARFVSKEAIDAEIKALLDAIGEMDREARKQHET
jgi:ABC-type taurine transport system ATPase subunit